MLSSINRLFIAHDPNPIIQYLDNNYHKAIADRPLGFTPNYPLYVQSHIDRLIEIVNASTELEKNEFLRHAGSQKKFFKIIRGLLIHYVSHQSPTLPLRCLTDLLEILALDTVAEKQFYHSKYFMKFADLELEAELSHTFQTLVLAAIQKYPKVEMHFFGSFPNVGAFHQAHNTLTLIL